MRNSEALKNLGGDLDPSSLEKMARIYGEIVKNVMKGNGKTTFSSDPDCNEFHGAGSIHADRGYFLHQDLQRFPQLIDRLSEDGYLVEVNVNKGWLWDLITYTISIPNYNGRAA